MTTHHHDRIGSRTQRYRAGLCLMLIGALAGATTIGAETTWQIPQADVRFMVKITRRPSAPGAGVIAVLPDGGILPRRFPTPIVVDPQGKRCPAEGLWQHPGDGLALVFDPGPGVNHVAIYVAAGRRPFPMPPSALRQFKPSLLFYGVNGGASLERAHRLARSAAAGPDVRFAVVRQVYDTAAPAGRDAKSSGYYTGWFRCRTAGRTYFYTGSQDGSEIAIDGKLVHSWPGRHKPNEGRDGRQGSWVTLTEGLHRIEYFLYSVQQRAAQLGWQQAGAKQPYQILKDAGGVAHKTTYPNRSVTGPMQPQDFVQSGAAIVTAAETPGGPLAVFNPRWISYIQPGEHLVGCFRFDPLYAASHPPGTTYEWVFDGQSMLSGKRVNWLFPGRTRRTVRLTLRSGDHVSRATRTFYPGRVPTRMSINNPAHRSRYREFFLAAARAKGKAPAATSWSPTMWVALRAISDYGRGHSLMYTLFQESYASIKGLPPELRMYFEDLLITALRSHDETGKLIDPWLDRLTRATTDAERRLHWKVARASHALYERNNPALARRILGSLLQQRRADSTEWIRGIIRRGDVDFLGGDYVAARKFYSDASVAAQRLRERTAREAARAAGTRPTARKRGPGDWRAHAVREGTLYRNFRAFMDQGQNDEARRVIEKWEIGFPMSKFDGEYVSALAEWWIYANARRRAVRIMQAHRAAVGMSLHLPRILEMELNCLVDLGDQEQLKKLAKMIVKDYHEFPVAVTAQRYLE
jgi:hypothetical protein